MISFLEISVVPTVSGVVHAFVCVIETYIENYNAGDGFFNLILTGFFRHEDYHNRHPLADRFYLFSWPLQGQKMQVMAILAVAFTAQIVPPSPWQNPANWQRIREGLPQQQVERILGAPAATESTPALEVWYYQDTPSGGDRPSAGRVVFRNSADGKKVLSDYRPPDWSRVPDWRQLNMEYRNQLVAQRHPLPAPSAVTAAPTSPALPQRLPPVTQQSSKPSPPAPALEDLQAKTASRYFIGCGIALGSMALIFAICQGSKFFR